MSLERRVVIVPVDRPVERSAEALRLGADLADRTGRRLVVVHVDPTFGEAAGRGWLDASLPGGAEVVVEPTAAHPADVVLHRIRRAGTPLVVMATAARRLATPRWGSTTERVVRSSPVPVLLVGPEVVAGPDILAGPVTVCLDGTATADAVVDPAAAFAAEIGAPLDLVGVGHAARPRRHRDPERWGVADLADHLGAVCRERLAEHPLHGDPVRLDGADVVEVLVARAIATGSSALAMATHARTGFERLALGSVVVEATHASPVPVLTVAARPVRPVPCPR